MKIILSLVACALATAFAAPAIAEPKTQAECEQIDGMTWDEIISECVKKLD